MEEEWIVPGKNRRLVKPRGADRRVKFDKRRRLVFLEHLAATCNVTASAEAAGVSWSAVYRCRMREPDFREDWREALEQGYALLEAALLEQALGGGRRIAAELEGPEAPPEIDWNKAMELLRNHGRHMGGRAEAPRTPARVPIEEVAKKLIARMKALGVRVED